jgi:hypothetical protein
MARPRGQAPNPSVLEREAEVVKLRRGGMTWDLIAQRTGFADPSGARQAYMRAASRVVRDDIEQIRQVEEDRLDLAQAAIWGDVMAGNIQAVNALVRIMERRARLLGLDRPVQHQVEVTVHDGDSIDAEVQRLVALLDSGAPGDVVEGKRQT